METEKTIKECDALLAEKGFMISELESMMKGNKENNAEVKVEVAEFEKEIKSTSQRIF